MAMTNPYCTLDEFKSAIEKEKNTSDATLEIIIESASRTLDRVCNRQDGFVAVAIATPRTFMGMGQGYLRIDECISVTKVEVKASATDSTYDTWSADDWILARGDPKKPDFNHTPYTLLITAPGGSYATFLGGRYRGLRGFRSDPDQDGIGVPTVRVTARWGYAATVPLNIKTACIAQSARWYKRFQSAFADTVGSADVGTLLYRMSLDPDIELMLSRARMIRPAVG